MPSHEADHLFRTFARTGDAAALGKLFDLLAADLLLVAVHLSRDGAEAEDLVQATFLRALEERARYDAARPVRPWMVGILSNLALQSRRRAGRRPDPARLGSRPARSPSEAAESHELVEAVSRTIEELPRHDRQVLTLRLVHGFKVAQIARALAVPVPTAKARLRRGLARLRQALPAGLVRGTAFFAVPEAGLSVLRARVLARAAELAPPAVAVAGAAAFKLATAFAAVALLGAVAWFGWPPTEPGVVETGAAGSPAQQETLAGDLATPIPDVIAAAPAPAPARVAVRDNDPEPAAGLRGRCVARESGAALADCEVVVRPRMLGMMRTPADAAAWKAVAGRSSRAASGPDGRFALTPPDVDSLGLSLEVRRAGRVAATCQLDPGSVEVDLGDIALARSIPVTGKIIDTDGEPVVDVFASFRNTSIYGGIASGTFHDVLPGYTPRTDRHGRFAIPDGLGAGTWSISVHYDLPTIRPDLFQIGENQQSADVEVVVLRPRGDQRISGIIRDARGVPLPGLFVSANGEPKAARTGDDGAFELRRTTGPDPVLGLHVSDDQWRVGPHDVAGPFVWGTHDVAIRMEPAIRVRVHVKDAATGNPVERFTLQRFPAHADVGGKLAIDYQPGGVAVVPAVDWGRTTILVVPEAGELEPSRSIVLEKHRLEGDVLRVALQRRVEIRVRVTRTDGSAVEGSTVAVLEDTGRTTLSPMPPMPVAIYRLGLAQFAALQLASAVTDARGEATLRVAPARHGRALRVRGSHVLLEVRDVVLQAGGEPLSLVVSSGGVLRGRVRPLEILEQLRGDAAADHPVAQSPWIGGPGLVLRQRHPAPTGFPAGSLNGWPLADDGTFEMKGVPPGRWEVSVRYMAYGPGGAGGTHETRLAEVDIRNGEPREIELDLAVTVPGILVGEVELDGTPYAASWISVEGVDQRGSMGSLHTDEAGRFRLPGLPPARYRIYLQTTNEQTGRQVYIAAERPCDLRPGETTRHVFRARRLNAFASCRPMGSHPPRTGISASHHPSASRSTTAPTPTAGWCSTRRRRALSRSSRPGAELRR